MVSPHDSAPPATPTPSGGGVPLDVAAFLAAVGAMSPEDRAQVQAAIGMPAAAAGAALPDAEALPPRPQGLGATEHTAADLADDGDDAEGGDGRRRRQWRGGASGTGKESVAGISRSDIGRLAAEIHELGPFIHPPCPNPAPLGLFAFGLTTALLQVKHTGLGGETEEDGRGTENLVWGYAVFFGGLLQLIAGAVEIKRNNIFGFTAFSTYGGFWLSLAAAHLFIDADSDVVFNSRAVQSMLVLMGIFTFILWLCTLKMNATISLLFFLLATTFFLLAGGVVNTTVDKVAGWVGMVTAATAYWLAAAELINDIVGGGKDFIPLWRFNPSNTGAVHVAGRLHGEGQRQALKGTSMGGFLRRASVRSMKVE